MSRDEPNMSGVIEERDQLRGAIQKIASLRKMELQQIDQYKQKIADSENLEKELNDLKVKNTSQAEMVKVVRFKTGFRCKNEILFRSPLNASDF